ncbi:MAG: FtsX-like permease family protein, partial [Acidimicrobiaceae bacterium]|nr:FtsX-like permease family protein [Acidimicrobiaceae bacterium]MYH92806.1 FtsX-like permease family protein [Acidimicrobiaceae bacterium]
VALVGIVNTLTLSVFERTHEIGLLRAVGMTRRQLRRVIRWEAATIALFGALVGVALGLAFGVALSVAIPDEIIDRVSVPGAQIGGLVLVAVVFGLLAAVFPSYRAGRMNVLEAIAAD